MWKASKLPESVLDDVITFQSALERGDIKIAEGDNYVSEADLDASIERLVDEGDAKGEFLSDMTDTEVLAYERNERLGWKKLKLPWQS